MKTNYESVMGLEALEMQGKESWGFSRRDVKIGIFVGFHGLKEGAMLRPPMRVSD